ncbi:hypothetical protein ZWY2020_016656 [Hordeum vulgare]|nr:hypothetical protein ZWY2020_016656 [Hordeum vulgare]
MTVLRSSQGTLRPPAENFQKQHLRIDAAPYLYPAREAHSPPSSPNSTQAEQSRAFAIAASTRGGMGSRYEVEVTVGSARDLKNVNWRNGDQPYAVVWVDGSAKCSTRVDLDNGENSEWDEKLVVVLPPFTSRLEDAVLRIDVVHTNAAEGAKPLVGSARLPLRDVLDDAGLGGRASRSLRLNRPSGRPQGRLDVRVAVREAVRYAVLWVDGSAKCSTRVDLDNGENSEWDEKLVVVLPPFTSRLEDAVLRIDVVHTNAAEGAMLFVGSARLPLREVVDDVELDGRASRSFRLTRPYGRPVGRLDVRVAVREAVRYSEKRKKSYQRHALGRSAAPSAPPPTRTTAEPEWGEKLVVPLPPFTARLEDVVLRIDVVHNADEGTIPLVRSARLPPHEFLDDVELDRRASRSLRLKHPYGWPQGRLDVRVVVREAVR